MKKILTALSVIIIGFTACQKEPSFEEPNPTQKTASGNQLIRSVEVEGSDSVMVNYSYDANGRLIWYDAYGTNAILLSIRMVRNSSGLITQVIAKSNELLAIGVDSLVYNIYSNASTSHYTYSSYSFTSGSSTISDSIVHIYSGNNLVSDISYEKTSGSIYGPILRSDYGYSGSNIVSEKEYDYDSALSTWVLSFPATYNYDTKISPLNLGPDGIIAGFTTGVGANNIIQEQSINSTVVTTVSYTYNYNSANKPLTGVRTITSPGSTQTASLRFYYN